jgi:hypothetical protein
LHLNLTRPRGLLVAHEHWGGKCRREPKCIAGGAVVCVGGWTTAEVPKYDKPVNSFSIFAGAYVIEH